MSLLSKIERPAPVAYYDGATLGRRGASIRRSNADANVITRSQLPRLRQGVRDLCRNNAHARRAVEVIVNNTVGTGIRPHFTRNGVPADDIERLVELSMHTTEIDSDRRCTYFGLQALGVQSMVEAGEVFVRRRRRRSSDGLTVPVQFQILEPEYVDESRDGATQNGGRIIQGIEFDALGRRRGYWMFREHPGGLHASARSTFVPAEDVLHMYRVDRPGQVRGVPWGATVMLRHADFADYEEAHLIRQKVAASFAGFIEEPFDSSLPGSVTENDDGELIDSIQPGILERLPPGTKITFSDPPGVEGYAEYSNVSMHALAMGWGVSYESLTGDLRGVSFSSGKMGHLEQQRNMHRHQELLIVPQLCAGMVAWWLEAAALVGVNTDGVKVRHIPPRNEMIDPPRERKAERDALRSGQKTFTQMIRESGRDPGEHLRELAKDYELLDSLNIVLDSDPRQRTSSGGDVGAGGEPVPAMSDEDAEAMEERVMELIAERNGAHR